MPRRTGIYERWEARVDVQSIIDRILADPRVRKSSALSGQTFSDEPILRRGSQMEGYLPKRCREMRAFASSPQAVGKPSSWVFYHQARMMEDYEDDVEYRGVFEHYFPTYQAMSDRQLRGYFTWRAHVRAHDVRSAPLSFAFVYVYELLMGVGVTPGVEGFHAIETFWHAYQSMDGGLDRYMRLWLRDYVVWHGLDRSLLAPYVDVSFDEALVSLQASIASWEGQVATPPLTTPLALLERPTGHLREVDVQATASSQTSDAPERHGRTRAQGSAPDGSTRPEEARMDEALDALSSYRPHVSRLWRDRPETLRHVCCAVVVQLARHYARRRKSGLMESLFGSPLAMPYIMFSSAVFWSEQHADCTYEVDEVNRYTCSHGRWYWEGYHGSHARSPQLGNVLRAADQRLRIAIGYKHPLVEREVPKYLAKIIDQEISARLTWEKKQEARRIHVDLSQLAGIRAAASVTREALLVDEEREDGPSTPVDPAPATGPAPAAGSAPMADPAPVASSAPMAGAAPVASSAPMADSAHATAKTQSATPAPAVAPTSAPSTADTTRPPFGLTSVEMAFLVPLLDGDKPSVAPGASEDMLVDSINEKLFDLLGDTALEFDASGRPAIIEDYLEDVRGAVLP